VFGLDPLAMIVGFYAAAFGQRWGAYVLLGWFLARLSLHLAIGVWGYARAMTRPWPKVEPLTDWDDD
jgi:hypothetical protein